MTERTAYAEIRLLTYNVRSMRDDRDALARVVRRCAPDVVCVQEAPRFLRWRHHAARLADMCGLTVVTGGATAAGPLLLASLRARVLRTRDVLLPRTPGLHRRGLAMACLEIGGARFAVASTHLGLDAGERVAQAPLALTCLRDLGEEHRILAGDVNEPPGDPAWKTITAELTDAREAAPWGGEFTSPRRDPARRIDGVFTSPGIEVVRCGVPDDVPAADYEAATDHRPVLAVLRVPRAGRGN